MMYGDFYKRFRYHKAISDIINERGLDDLGVIGNFDDYALIGMVRVGRVFCENFMNYDKKTLYEIFCLVEAEILFGIDFDYPLPEEDSDIECTEYHVVAQGFLEGFIFEYVDNEYNFDFRKFIGNATKEFLEKTIKIFYRKEWNM